MEASSILILYKRSVEKNRLYYDPFVGDGDSSSYREVCREQVYGPIKMIGKEEDICHVTKKNGNKFTIDCSRLQRQG